MLKNIVKIVGLTLLLLIVTIIAQNIGILWHILDLNSLEYLFHGLTYLIITLLLFKWVAHKILKRPLTYFRVTSFRVNRVSVLVGVLLIVFVIGSYLIFVPGHLVVTQVENKEEYSAMLIEILFIGGIVAPIIEEIMFRGILMKYIEYKTNIYLALIITSILFGMVHVLNGLVTGTSLILLVVSITTAGLMYGLAAYLFNTVWASIVIHMIWNLSAVMTITNQHIEYSVVQYIINTKNPLLTGGAYGTDASLISIIGYMSISLVLLVYYNRSKHRKGYNDMY